MRSFGLYVLVGLAAATVAVAFYFIEPAPPAEIRIAAGSRNGAYYPIAARLAERMGRHGVRVEILETNGAAQNLGLLAGDAPPELALIQGGTHPPKGQDTSSLRTLASVDLEPVWLIARPDSRVSSLRDIAGMAVAAGQKGSGTIDLFRTLLRATGQPLPPRTSFDSNINAVEAFRARRADLIFSVSPADNQWLRPLLRGTEVRFVELEEAPALTRNFAFLNSITLPRASLDLARNIPKRDITLLATATNLVTTESVHAATKMLALQALREIDHGTLLLNTDGRFPNLKYAEYAVDPEAKRFFSTGPPFIRRYLPYWVANLVERFYAFLLPLITIALPLVRLVPAWLKRHRREMTRRWYERLAEAEKAVTLASGDEAELQRCSRHLDSLERQLEQHRSQIAEPQEYFSLRFHIERVRRQLWRKLIGGWLESESGAAVGESGTVDPDNLESYRALLGEIERDLSLFADLEARFKTAGIPGEFYGDVLDVKHGLKRARERLLSLDGSAAAAAGKPDITGAQRTPAKPAIAIVSDRTSVSSRSSGSDNGEA